LRLRSFRTPRGTDATVPAGLPVGSYDLLAVNPDGTVGLLPAAFRVAAAAPPRISALSPTSVTGWGTRTVTVLGEHFDDPTVAVTCRLPAGTFVAPSVTRIAFDADSIEFSVDLGTTPVVAGATCMVRVTNADGAYDSSSALGVVNVSYNLDSFTPAPNLRVPRRAPCAVAAEAAPGVRRVYAIGGDDGTNRETTATTRYDSIESAAVGPHGDVSDWSLESSTLPVPLSFHGCAALGRFVYVVGGSDGTSAIATAYRGQILDPEQAPALADGRLAVHPEEPAVFTAGSYSYRIAATLPSDHPENPGGETLAGDALTVQVPVLSVGLSITLSWNEFPGAAGYRVYRTPTPGLAADEARLLAVLPPTARTFEDDGSAATGLETALPLGAMGRFAVLPALTTPREGMGVALAADPTDPTISYLYVLGGRTSGHTALAGVEWLAIQVETDGRQTVADAWTAGAASIGTPRWQLAAFVADSRTAPATVAPGTTWIYAGGGFAADVSSAYPTPLNDTVALRVASGGALGEGAGNRWVVDNMQPESAGYAGIVLLDQLFVFGGGHGLPGSQGFSIRICTNDIASCSGGPPAAPDLGNWNNIGLSMSHARYLPGATSLGIFVFLVGGVEGWDLPWHPLAAVETIHG